MRVGLLIYGTDRPLQGVTRAALELASALNSSGACQLVPLMAGGSQASPCGKSAGMWVLPGCSRLPVLMLLGGPLISVAARRLSLDLVHDPIGIAPFTLGRWSGSFARVVTIHDATPFRYPQGYPWLNNFLYRRYLPVTLSAVDAVITDSAFSRQEIDKYYRITAQWSHVVPLGVTGTFGPVQPEVAQRTASRYRLSSPYILSVGSQQARKNLPTVVEAFARLHERHPETRLAIVGPSLWRYEGLREQLSRLRLQDAVVRLGSVPDPDLAALYAGASVFVLASLFEGFGLPVLEAMACGTPVVCSNTTSLPEVAGNAALLINPNDAQSLCDAIESVMCDSKLADLLRHRGRQRASEFSWESTAQQTLNVYRYTLQDRKARHLRDKSKR
ncbi:MAG: glycosyltransferase family 4 protein [Chloroflexi bacterium]|nr:glycosyltransferase family 4 protein [Chloroflexota bacterium]